MADLLSKISALREQLTDTSRSLEDRAKTDISFFDWNISFSDVFAKGGFDIVIGNPPYISAVTMARSKNEKMIYKSLYPQATGAYDLYVLFLLLANKISKQIYTWIIPNKFLIADYAAKVKEELITKGGLQKSIDVSVFNVFKNANVYPIIILGNKQLANTFEEHLLDEYEDLLKGRTYAKKTVAAERTILSVGLDVCCGATGFEAEFIKQFVKNGGSKNSIPFTVSGNIDPYKYNNSNVRYMKAKYNNAFVYMSEAIPQSKRNMWMNPKIVIAGMTKRVEATYVEDPLAIGVGTYAITSFAGFNPLFILGVLNSKYTSYYLINKFRDKHLAGGYLAINKSTIEQLPFPNAPIKIQNEIIKRVTILLENYDLSLETEIDELVYDLYGLTEEEKEIIRKS